MADEIKQVIVVRDDLKIGKGKMAAHVAHASLEAYKKAKRENPEAVEQWEQEGQKKIVVRVKDEKELVELFEQAKKEAPASLIKDAGHTQVEPGTITAVAIGPADSRIVDKFTAKLRLL